MVNLQQNRNLTKSPKYLKIVNKVPTIKKSEVFNLQKVTSFQFYPIDHDLVNTETHKGLKRVTRAQCS